MNANIMKTQIFHLDKYDPSPIGWSIDASLSKLGGSLSLSFSLSKSSPLMHLVQIYGCFCPCYIVQCASCVFKCISI